MSPEVTVLMSVYNGEKYLRESIDSILNQSFSNFKFLIIDDASTDSSREIIRSYKDKRVKLVENVRNLGQSESLNRGLEKVEGKYIARMDQDDISLPQRLQKQVHFMNDNDEIGVCGTYVGFTDETNSIIVHSYLRDPLVNNEELKGQLLFSPCFVHPTVMIRANIVFNHKISYCKQFEPAEDYWMWKKLSSVTDFANLNEPLLKLREHDDQVTSKHFRRQSTAADNVRTQILLEFLGEQIDHEDLNLHRSIAQFGRLKSSQEILAAEAWLNNLIGVNRIRVVFEENALRKVIALIWYYLCINSTHLGMKVLKRHYNSSLYSSAGETFRQNFAFFLKCLIKHKVRLS
jgi:glycosyltransferase involved in cell wall biosynthesis